MPKSTGPNPWKLRKCKSCKLLYAPTCRDAANARKSLFCTAKCKNYYHRNGGMDMERMEEVLERRLLKRLLADEVFLEAVADKMRVVNARALTDGGLMRNVLERALQMPRSGGTSPNKNALPVGIIPPVRVSNVPGDQR